MIQDRRCRRRGGGRKDDDGTGPAPPEAELGGDAGRTASIPDETSSANILFAKPVPMLGPLDPGERPVEEVIGHRSTEQLAAPQGLREQRQILRGGIAPARRVTPIEHRRVLLEGQGGDRGGGPP